MESLLNTVRDELNVKKAELDKSNEDNKMLQVWLPLFFYEHVVHSTFKWHRNCRAFGGENLGSF